MPPPWPRAPIAMAGMFRDRWMLASVEPRRVRCEPEKIIFLFAGSIPLELPAGEA
jgi:hypothetical protein